MLLVDFGGFDGHRAVQKYRKRSAFLKTEHPSEQTDQKLSAAYGECRDQDFAAARHGFLHYAYEFIHRIHKWPVIAVAVSGLQENQIRALERLVISKYRDPSRPEIPGKDHRLLAAI